MQDLKLLVTGNWQQAAGYWLLAAGYWLLAAGNWQLAAGCCNWLLQLATGGCQLPKGRISDRVSLRKVIN